MSARLRTAVVALALGAALLLPVLPTPAATADQWPAPGVTVIAHRCNNASAAYTEQTMHSCARAAATGATILDVDVRWSKSTSTSPAGVPVALHDADLGVFGAPDVQVVAVSYTSARGHVSTRGQNLATIRQVRDIAVAAGMTMSVEPKVDPTDAQWDTLATALGPLKSTTFLNSFDPAVLAEAASEGYTRLGLNASAVPAVMPDGVPVLILRAASVEGSQTIDAALEAGAQAVWCYGVTDPDRMAELIGWGVTGLATDDHDAAERLLATLP